jgi:hypothetical protein
MAEAPQGPYRQPTLGEAGVPSALRPIGWALLVSAVVAGLSYGLPSRMAATGVGLGFLAATWWLVLRLDDETVRRHGLALGGLLEPGRLDVRAIARSAGVALAGALAASAVVFPLFVIGYRLYWGHVVGRALTWQGAPLLLPPRFLDETMGQLLVIALPEEAFYRGYLQTALDAAWPPRWTFLGARIGLALPVSCAIFALGHVATEPSPARLAVFFPALLFGFLRARTGGIGAGVIFHAACNLAVLVLQRNYGLIR